MNIYSNIFKNLNIKSYKEFVENSKTGSLVAGTIMSIQEKKSIKGTPFAIVKFSDKFGEYELFLFSENLISNRDKLKESESFVMTLQKDNSSSNQLRVNVRKILKLDDMVNKTYENVSIELNENYDLNEIEENLKIEGNTKIKLIVPKENKKLVYSLEKMRKFDLSVFNNIKNIEFIKKITF